MMHMARIAMVAALFASCGGTRVRRAAMRQEPDTACGKGFDELVPGTKDYFATASVELFTHPGKLTDNATFATEFQCWFAHMVTQSCGGLASQASTRKKPLSKACTNVKDDWMVVWKMFTEEEVTYFKKEYPAKDPSTDPTAEEGTYEPNTKVDTTKASDGESPIAYKQAMETVKLVDKKELLCLTLFTIDDECVKHEYIRMAK